MIIWNKTKYMFYGKTKYEIYDFHYKIQKWINEAPLDKTAWNGSAKWLGNILLHLGFDKNKIIKRQIAPCKGEITNISEEVTKIPLEGKEALYFFSVETRTADIPMYEVWCKFIDIFYKNSSNIKMAFLFYESKHNVIGRLDEDNIFEYINIPLNKQFVMEYHIENEAEKEFAFLHQKNKAQNLQEVKNTLEEIIGDDIYLKTLKNKENFFKTIKKAQNMLKEFDTKSYFNIYPVKNFTSLNLKIKFMYQRNTLNS